MKLKLDKKNEYPSICRPLLTASYCQSPDKHRHRKEIGLDFQIFFHFKDLRIADLFFRSEEGCRPPPPFAVSVDFFNGRYYNYIWNLPRCKYTHLSSIL